MRHARPDGEVGPARGAPRVGARQRRQGLVHCGVVAHPLRGRSPCPLQRVQAPRAVAVQQVGAPQVDPPGGVAVAARRTAGQGGDLPGPNQRRARIRQ